MNLLDFAEQAITFDAKDTVTKVTSKMFRDRNYTAVITRSGNYEGVVVARDIATRNINNPDKVEIKQFVTAINPISPQTPIKYVIESVLINNYNTVPISDQDGVKILTKLGMLNIVKDSESFKKYKAKDIMRYPYCVNADDNISIATSILKEMGVSRIPVLSKTGSIEGLLTTIDLLKADTTRERSTVGEKYGEKQKYRDHPVSSIMNRKTVKIDSSSSIKNVIELMLKEKVETVLIEDNNKIAGIITPKEILKILTDARREKEIEDRANGIYVRISGIQEEDVYIKGLIDSEITNEVKKLAKIIRIKCLVLHVSASKSSGHRKKYSVKGKLITEKGYFFANDEDWDLTKTVRSVMNKFERETMKAVGK